MATAVVAGLMAARRTGKGQYMDVSAVEALMSFCPEPLLEFQVPPTGASRVGNYEMGRAPCNVYACANEAWIALSIGDDSEWERLTTIAEGQSFATDPRFRHRSGRERHQAALDEELARWTIQQDARELTSSMQAARIPASIVFNARDFAEDSHLQERDAWITVEHAVVGKRVLLRPPWRIPDLPNTGISPAPLLGQHTDDVLSSVGLSATEIASLRESGVLH